MAETRQISQEELQKRIKELESQVGSFQKMPVQKGLGQLDKIGLSGPAILEIRNMSKNAILYVTGAENTKRTFLAVDLERSSLVEINLNEKGKVLNVHTEPIEKEEKKVKYTVLIQEQINKAFAKADQIQLNESKEKGVLDVYFAIGKSIYRTKLTTEQLREAEKTLENNGEVIPLGLDIKRKNLPAMPEGKVTSVHIDKKNIVKRLLEWSTEEKGLSWEEGIRIYHKGEIKNPISFTYTKENEEYIKADTIYELVPNRTQPNTIKTGIIEKQKNFQALATTIIREKYGDKEVSKTDAVKMLNEWVNNNIKYNDIKSTNFVEELLELFYSPGKGSIHSFSSPEESLMAGSGICFDQSHLLMTLCNSIGIPARSLSVGAGTSVQKLAGVTFHLVTEANIDGKWVVFDPTNIRSMPGSDYFGSREEYSKAASSVFHFNSQNAYFVPCVTKVSNLQSLLVKTIL